MYKKSHQPATFWSLFGLWVSQLWH